MSCVDYYWRDYNGIIPLDALVGGKRSNGENIYIVQGYVPNEGIIVGYVTPGSRDVYVQINGIKLATTTKILCGHQQNFDWVATGTQQMHNDLHGKKPVIGGYQNNRGDLYVARYRENGETYIGKIVLTGPYAKIFFGVKENVHELRVNNYEILVYTR